MMEKRRSTVVIAAVVLALLTMSVFYTTVQQRPLAFVPDYMVEREYVLPTDEEHTINFGDYEVVVEYGGELDKYASGAGVKCFVTYSLAVSKNEVVLLDMEQDKHACPGWQCCSLNSEITHYLDYINEEDHLTVEVVPADLVQTSDVCGYGHCYYHADNFKLIVTYPANGDVQITSDPSDAQVFMDVRETLFGDPEEIYIGQTPVEVEDVLIGTHTFRIHKTGYDDYYANVLVTEEDTKLVHAVLLGVAPIPVDPIIPICTDGEYTCMGDNRMICLNDTQWVTIEVCSFGCDPLLKKCKEEVVICTPGDRVCSGKTLLECNEFGTGFVVDKYCQYGCSNGACNAAPTNGVPGFEAVFAIAGLLVVSYLLLRRRRKD